MTKEKAHHWQQSWVALSFVEEEEEEEKDESFCEQNPGQSSVHQMNHACCSCFAGLQAVMTYNNLKFLHSLIQSLRPSLLPCQNARLPFPLVLGLGSGGQWIEKKGGVKCELTTHVRENWKRMKVTFQPHNDVNMGDSIPRKRTLEDDKIRGRKPGEEWRSPGLVFNSSRSIILS